MKVKLLKELGKDKVDSVVEVSEKHGKNLILHKLAEAVKEGGGGKSGQDVKDRETGIKNKGSVR